MRPELEQYLRERIRKSGETDPRKRLPRDVIAEMIAAGMIASPKQAWRTLQKWERLRLYDYGVTVDLGWLVERVPEVAEQKGRSA